jgi:hypothetical protein
VDSIPQVRGWEWLILSRSVAVAVIGYREQTYQASFLVSCIIASAAVPLLLQALSDAVQYRLPGKLLYSSGEISLKGRWESTGLSFSAHTVSTNPCLGCGSKVPSQLESTLHAAKSFLTCTD